jgi:hypothetical protein
VWESHTHTQSFECLEEGRSGFFPSSNQLSCFHHILYFCTTRQHPHREYFFSLHFPTPSPFSRIFETKEKKERTKCLPQHPRPRIPVSPPLPRPCPRISPKPHLPLRQESTCRNLQSYISATTYAGTTSCMQNCKASSTSSGPTQWDAKTSRKLYKKRDGGIS